MFYHYKKYSVSAKKVNGAGKDSAQFQPISELSTNRILVIWEDLLYTGVKYLNRFQTFEQVTGGFFHAQGKVRRHLPQHQTKNRGPGLRLPEPAARGKRPDPGVRLRPQHPAAGSGRSHRRGLHPAHPGQGGAGDLPPGGQDRLSDGGDRELPGDRQPQPSADGDPGGQL